MYIPKLYREDERTKIIEFMRQNEFALLVTIDDGKPAASHLLVEVVESGDRLLVNGHMSKANPQWRTFGQNTEVLVIFQGPHTYIRPRGTTTSMCRHGITRRCTSTAGRGLLTTAMRLISC